MSVSVRPATVRDCFSLAPRLREADKQEIMAAMGCGPLDGLLVGLMDSDECWVAIVDAEPQSIWGVGEGNNGEGIVWMLGTDKVALHKRDLMRLSRRFIRRWLRVFPVLGNYVDARNTAHVNYIRHLGFELGDPVPYGFEGRLFIPFRMRRKQCVR